MDRPSAVSTRRQDKRYKVYLKKRKNSTFKLTLMKRRLPNLFKNVPKVNCPNP